jgi:hypothetical protein
MKNGEKREENWGNGGKGAYGGDGVGVAGQGGEGLEGGGVGAEGCEDHPVVSPSGGHEGAHPALLRRRGGGPEGDGVDRPGMGRVAGETLVLLLPLLPLLPFWLFVPLLVVCPFLF